MGNQARTKEHQQFVLQLRRSGATTQSPKSRGNERRKALQEASAR